MHTTRLSLLQQISAGDDDGWAEADRLYGTMIRRWLRDFSLSHDDADDICQEVMARLVKEISEFQHNGRVGAFRNWLRTTTVNLARNHLRKKNVSRGTGSSDVQQMLGQLQDPSSKLSKQFNLEHDRSVMRALLSKVRQQFEPVTVNMFQVHVVQGLSARETAERLEVPVASVHTAKSRVLRRLRELAKDCLDVE